MEETPASLHNQSKFIVVQRGARRGYAVPKILHHAGMLDRMETDVAGNVGLGRLISLAKHLPWAGAAFRKLANRRVPAEVCPLTRSSIGLTLSEHFREKLGPNDAVSQFRRLIEVSDAWGHHILKRGFGNATHIYSMMGEGGPFIAHAHRMGLKVITEIYILLSTERILEEERKLFPTWEPDSPDYSSLREKYIKENVILNHTDYYICPSETVQDDLVSHWSIARGRTALVPYGMNPEWLKLEPRPQPGRVLFVGTADLRKGIHYLAMAAEKLQARGRSYEFRVAGNVTDQVRRQPLCRHLNFLGRVPRDRIHEEFQQADVFVLPSLAEGSAEVTYEALAAGVPLVVTRAAGSVARDGVEGRIISERDPMALADALEAIIENREIRHRMAAAARLRAADYIWERYGQRLIATLTSLMEP